MEEPIIAPSTPTAQTVSKPVSKWNDPDFVREYNRKKWREKHPLKRHPNKMDDGSLWSDHHPYGRFQSLQEKHDHYMATYKPKVPKIECKLCKQMYYETQEERHKQNKKHKQAMELIEGFMTYFIK